MNTVFLLGAGASHGSGDCSPYRPPLGKGEEGLFPELQRWGGVASTVESPLRDKFVDDFEKGMEEFYRYRSIDITSFLREMAGYFAQFEPGPNNYYAELVRIVSQASGNVVLATTNYDLLLELAISRAGFPIVYGWSPHYRRGDIRLLKIHGSCNFLPDQERFSMGEATIALNYLQDMDATPIEDLPMTIYSGPVKAAKLHETREFCRTNASMAPAIGLYLPGKHTLWGSSFVKRWQELWQEAVKRAGRIYVIGAAIYEHDDHIWDVLANAQGELRYVDPYPDRFLEWCERVGRKNASVMARSFEEALPLLRRQMQSR